MYPTIPSCVNLSVAAASETYNIQPLYIRCEVINFAAFLLDSIKIRPFVIISSKYVLKIYLLRAFGLTNDSVYILIEVWKVFIGFPS